MNSARAALCLVLAALSAVGQTLPVTGVVLDPSDRAIPEAVVVLRSGGKAIAEQVTGADGAFRFDRMAAGSYEVTVRRESFQQATRGVRIGGRAPGLLVMRLRLADLREEINVTDSHNLVSSQIGDNLDVPRIDREMLDKLPSMNNDPLSAIMRFVDLSSLGDSGVDVVVDGMSGSAKAVSPSAIQEVRINQNPYTAEYANQGGARIEVITAAGGTAFHGGVNYIFRDHHLDARPAFAATRPPDHRNGFDGNFTGPLGKGKKTSFLLTGDSTSVTNNPVIVARTLAGDVRMNSVVTARDSFLSARITHQLSKTQQVSLRLEYSNTAGKGAGTGGFVLPEAGTRTSNFDNHIFFQHRAMLTPRLVHDFQIRVGRRRNRVESLQDAMKIVVPGAFTSGGAQADSLTTESRGQWHWTLGYAAGRHSWKGGVNSPDVNRRALVDRSNFAGTFTFSTLDDYRTGRPFSFQQQQGDPRAVVWQKELGVFLEDEYRVRPGLSVSLGLRWDWQNFFGDNNNFAPRLAFAWAPRQSRKTVFRGGAGYFYDRGQWRALADTVRYDGQHLRDILIRDPSFTLPITAAAQPLNITRFDPTIRTPYRLQFGFGVERQLRKSTLAINYRGMTGTKLFRSRDRNAPLPGAVQRPNPALGVFREFESAASMRSDNLEVMLRTTGIKRFFGTMQYVLGRARNNTDGLYAFPADNWDLRLEWAPHDEIRRHRFQMTGTVKVPRRLGDLGLVFQTATGNALSLTTGRDDNHDGFARDRPPGVRRNSLTAPSFAELDLRWSRELLLDAQKKEKGPTLTLAVDATNAVNRMNPAGIVGNQSSPFFLQSVNSRPPRRLMLSLRLKF